MNKQFLNALGFTIPLATFGILLYDHSSLLVYLFAMFGAVFSLHVESTSFQGGGIKLNYKIMIETILKTCAPLLGAIIVFIVFGLAMIWSTRSK